MTKILIVLASLGLAGAAASPAQPASVSKRIAKIMSAADGTSEQTAYRVKSTEDEYRILAILHLSPKVQSLTIGKKPFDIIEATDENGATRKVWFDISSFYPEF